MIDIVDEIIVEALRLIPLSCPDFAKELDYVYDLEMNSSDSMEKRFGFIPLSSDSVSGVMSAKTFDHTFQVILTEEVDNQDSDKDMREKISLLYSCMFKICEDFKANCFVLSDPKQQVKQVKPGGFDIPEILENNNGVALRMNLIFQYSFRK